MLGIRSTDETGTVTVMMVGVITVAIVFMMAVIFASGGFTAHTKAQSAADQAAIAAADAQRGLTSADPCGRASEVAAANGAVLASCEPLADGDVRLRVNVVWAGLTLTAHSRAGAPSGSTG